VESFLHIATACGYPERGVALQQEFHAQMQALSEAIGNVQSEESEAANQVVGASSRPRVLLLEWLDPPFDGGHWVPDLIRAARCIPALNQVNQMR
jgi:iron complex transport system substrate-binding protein